MQANQSSCLLLFHSILCFVKTWPPAETSSSYKKTKKPGSLLSDSTAAQFLSFSHTHKKKTCSVQPRPTATQGGRRCWRLSDLMQLPAETQRDLFNRFYVCSSNPRHLNTDPRPEETPPPRFQVHIDLRRKRKIHMTITTCSRSSTCY